MYWMEPLLFLLILLVYLRFNNKVLTKNKNKLSHQNIVEFYCSINNIKRLCLIKFAYNSFTAL